MANELSAADKSQFKKLEAIIEKGIQGFKETGEALLKIRDGKLYREGFKTFEVYCQHRWKFSKVRATQFIQAAEVTNDLVTNGYQNNTQCTEKISPKNERQVRPLVDLPKEKRAQAWAKAIDSANGKEPTAKQVQEAVEDLDIPEPPEEANDDFGYAIPERARAAFELAKQFETACRQITLTFNPLFEICDGRPGTRRLKPDISKALMTQFKQSILANIAYAVCPYCDGNGECKGCNSDGWIHRSGYDSGKTQRESHSQLKARLSK